MRHIDEEIHYVRILKVMLAATEHEQCALEEVVRRSTYWPKAIEQAAVKAEKDGFIVVKNTIIYFTKQSLKACRKFIMVETKRLHGRRFIKPDAPFSVGLLQVDHALIIAEMLDLNAKGQQIYSTGIAKRLGYETTTVWRIIKEHLVVLGYVTEQKYKKMILFTFTTEGKKACYNLVTKATDIFE